MQIDIIEDDPPTARLLRLIAERHGATVRVFRSAEEAMAVMLAAPPAAAIVDVQLDGVMTGYDLVGQLRASPASTHVRILVISAAATREDEHHALRGGADAWMAKPVSIGRVADFVIGADTPDPDR